MVDSRVDEIRVIERQLRGAVDDIVCRLGAQHEAVVLVADLVPPAAEAAAGVDVPFLQFGQQLLEHAFALEARGRVPVVEAAVVGRDNLVGGSQHLGVEQTLDAVFEHVGGVDGFHA